jgi:Ca2+-dependent lipid-binding protein
VKVRTKFLTLTLQFAGNKEIRTPEIKNTFNPVWNERLILPVVTPAMSDTIKIILKDYDKVSKKFHP